MENSSTTVKKPSFIRRFFSRLMRFLSGLRRVLANIVFVVFLGILFAVFSGDEMMNIPEKGALIINPTGTVVDQLSFSDPLVQLLGETDPQQTETLLQDIIDAIELAKDDSRINSAVLILDDLAYSGISKTQEIAKALEAFRQTGKRIIAVGDSYSQDQYLLASLADEVYINPMGSVILQGYGLYRSYFKQAIDKLSVNYHVFRVGSYKSALEPFMRDNMSPAAKEANMAWLSGLWNTYTREVADSRKITPGDLNRYINQLDVILQDYSGDAAVAAMATGLVDGIKSRDEMNHYLASVVGEVNEEGLFEGIGFRQYNRLNKLDKLPTEESDTVGIIIARGNIIDGHQPPGMIGGDTLAEVIQQARNDAAVQAVVLRIDSGGGSVFASEIIRHELELLQRAGKPLVVSMGSLAASGGYWIAAGADEIWATPTTLTGSIGIYGAFPTFEKSLSRMGINNDGVGTTELAGSFRIDRPFGGVAARATQLSVEHGYDQFLAIVAEGRGISKKDVNKIAQGRVWTGADALKIGLVDHLGGMGDAIKSAAKLAGLEDYQQRIIEGELTPQEQMLKMLMNVFSPASVSLLSTMDYVSPQLKSFLQPLLESINFLNDPRGMYAYCAACIAP
jgi:protease-4